MEFMGTTPSNTARLDGGEELPASWRIEGPAFGFTDWTVDVLGEIRQTAGARVAVLLRTPLGLLTGSAIIASQTVVGDGFRSHLVSDGGLTVSPHEEPHAEAIYLARTQEEAFVAMRPHRLELWEADRRHLPGFDPSWTEGS